MSNPLSMFRKHQYIFLVVFGVMLMVAFIVLPPLDDYLRTQRGPGGSGDPVVVRWKGGQLRETDLERMRLMHRVAVSYLFAIVDETQRREGTPRGVRQGQFGQILDPGIPSTMSDENLVHTKLLAEKGESMGLVISDQAIAEFLEQLSDETIRANEMGRILKEALGDQFTAQQVLNQLRIELLAQRVRSMAEAGLYVPPYGTVPPAQAWEYHQRLHRRVQIETVALNVEDYVDRVSGPTEEQAKELYDEGKNRFPFPDSPEPGFRRRRKAAFQFIRADFNKFLEEEKAKIKVTDEEVEQYYEENKATRYKQLDLPETDSSTTENGENAGTSAPGDSEPADKALAPPADDAPAPPADDAPAPPSDDAPADDAPPPSADDAPAAPADSPPAESKTGDDGPAPPADDAPAAPADDAPASPADDAPASPADDAPAPPAEDTPAPPADSTPADSPPADSAPAPPDETVPTPETSDGARIDRKRQEFFVALQSGEDDSPPAAEATEAVETPPEPSPQPPADPAEQAQPPSAEPKPQDPTPDATAPAEPQPASSQPASSQPDVGSEDAEPEAPKFRPLDDELRQEIREELTERQARQPAQARIDKALAELRSLVTKLGREKRNALRASRPDDDDAEPAGPLDVDDLAGEHGLTVSQIPLIDALEAAEYELGEAFDMQFTSWPPTRQNFTEVAFADDVRRYSPATIGGSSGVQFLYWKTDGEQPYVPSFSEARDEVEAAWKRLEAVKIAESEARNLRAELANSGQTLAERFAESEREVITPPEFSWMTAQFTGGSTGTPALSDIEGIENAGPEFMQQVFATSTGEYGVATNMPKSKVYVFRVVSESPPVELLRQMFLASGDSQEVQYIAYVESLSLLRDWYANLESELDVTWLREPDAAA